MLSVAFKPAPFRLENGGWLVRGFLCVVQGRHQDEIALEYDTECATEELARSEFLRRARKHLADHDG